MFHLSLHTHFKKIHTLYNKLYSSSLLAPSSAIMTFSAATNRPIFYFILFHLFPTASHRNYKTLTTSPPVSSPAFETCSKSMTSINHSSFKFLVLTRNNDSHSSLLFYVNLHRTRPKATNWFENNDYNNNGCDRTILTSQKRINQVKFILTRFALQVSGKYVAKIY